jgi:hypothetical protein
MASIFGDESADGKAEVVFAVAGLVGLDFQWDETVNQWIQITKGEEFHATDWEHNHGPQSYKELVEVVRSSGLHGWGVGVDLVSFRAAFPDLTQDYAYHKCFFEVADRLIRVSAEHGYEDLRFTFDGRQGQGTTGLLYDYISAQKEWTDLLSFAGGIAFDNRKNPRIQIADLLARETMRGFEHALRNAAYRKSFVALASSGRRIQFDFLLGEYFSQWREGLRGLEKTTGIYANEYLAWIEKKNMQDNLNSRIRYLIWYDTKVVA